MSQPWSARRAVMAMHRAYSGWDASDPSVPIDERHLARAYLAGIEAARSAAPRSPHSRTLVGFAAAERARLLGPGKAKRGGKPK